MARLLRGLKPALIAALVVSLLASALFTPTVFCSPDTQTDWIASSIQTLINDLWNSTHQAFKASSVTEPYNYWTDDQGKILDLLRERLNTDFNVAGQTKTGSWIADKLLTYLSSHYYDGVLLRRDVETQAMIKWENSTHCRISNRVIDLIVNRTIARNQSLRVVYMPQGMIQAYIQGHQFYYNTTDHDLSYVMEPTSSQVIDNSPAEVTVQQIWDYTDFKLTLNYTLRQNQIWLEVAYKVEAKKTLSDAKLIVPFDQCDYVGAGAYPNGPRIGYTHIWIPGDVDRRSNDTENQHFLPNAGIMNQSWFMIHNHAKPDSVSWSLAIISDWRLNNSVLGAVDNSLAGSSPPEAEILRLHNSLHWVKQYAFLGPPGNQAQGILSGQTKTFKVRYFFLNAHDWTDLRPYQTVFSNATAIRNTDCSLAYSYGPILMGLAKLYAARQGYTEKSMAQEYLEDWYAMYTAAGNSSYAQSLPFALRAALQLKRSILDQALYYSGLANHTLNDLLDNQNMNLSQANNGSFREKDYRWPGTTNALTNPGFETGALTPWTFTQETGSGGSAQINNVQQRTGSYCAEVVLAAGSNEVFLLQDNLPVQGLQTFTFSAYAKLSTSGSYKAKIEVVQKNYQGQTINVVSGSFTSLGTGYLGFSLNVELHKLCYKVGVRLHFNGSGALSIYSDDAVTSSVAKQYYSTCYIDFNAPAINALSDYYDDWPNSTVLSRLQKAEEKYFVGDSSAAYRTWANDPRTGLPITVPCQDGAIVIYTDASGTIVDQDEPAYKDALILENYGWGDLNYNDPIALIALSHLWQKVQWTDTAIRVVTGRGSTESNTETQPWGIRGWKQYTDHVRDTVTGGKADLRFVSNIGKANITSLAWTAASGLLNITVDSDTLSTDTLTIWTTAEPAGVYVAAPTWSWGYNSTNKYVTVTAQHASSLSYLLILRTDFNIQQVGDYVKIWYNGTADTNYNFTGVHRFFDTRLVVKNSTAQFNLTYDPIFWHVYIRPWMTKTHTIWLVYKTNLGFITSNAPMRNAEYSNVSALGLFEKPSGNLTFALDTGIFQHGPRYVQLINCSNRYGNGTYSANLFNATYFATKTTQAVYIYFEYGAGTGLIYVVVGVSIVVGGVVYVARRYLRRR